MNKKDLEIIKDLVRSMMIKEAVGEILVPDSIKIEDLGGSLGIGFNNGKQCLYMCGDVYCVCPISEEDYVKRKLTPIKREDLKVGDTAYRRDNDDSNFTHLVMYCKILNDKKDAFIFGEKEVRVNSTEYNHWWKVEKV